MALARTQRIRIQITLAILLIIVAVPALVALGTFSDDQPILAGRPSPRTVVAEGTVRIVDQVATDNARRVAAETVEPITVIDPEAQQAIIEDVKTFFSSIRAARTPIEQPTVGEDGEPTTTTRPPTPEEQLDLLGVTVTVLDREALAPLVALTATQLTQVETEVVGVAQVLARLRFDAEDMSRVVEDQLTTEMAVRSFPGDLETLVVEPLIRAVARPTLRVDPDATADARDRAAEAVSEVSQVWQPGDEIVTAGEEVTDLEYEALQKLGLEGAELWVTLIRALAAMLLTLAVVVAYLHKMQPRVWRSARKLLLLATLVAGYAAVVAGISLFAQPDDVTWWYVVPAGALAMLVAILVHPVVGIASMLPAVVLVLLTAPVSAGVGVFVAATVLLTVPLVTRLGSRHELRQAAIRAGGAIPLIALVTVAVFGPRDRLPEVVGAAALNGIATALIVQGLLPTLETQFRLPTVTALLDLADRNHPLLRELEQKAIGSYNHSVMVASLVERACRAVGADGLLGSVAALYHDIGKVRRPHFFIENQQGIANPHDELEPQISARIIQEHVVDGVKIAREYHLPPEVVACIGSHHGTMVVTYFYRKAVEQAGGRDAVDEAEFRYKGTRPHSKEAAILLVADCCEATTRAMAMNRGTLPRDEIETTVDRLIQERLDDQQFAESDLTFSELTRVRNSIVEALVGIYHPRIAYPAEELPSEFLDTGTHRQHRHADGAAATRP